MVGVLQGLGGYAFDSFKTPTTLTEKTKPTIFWLSFLNIFVVSFNFMNFLCLIVNFNLSCNFFKHDKLEFI